MCSSDLRITGGNWSYNARGDIETDGEGKKLAYDARYVSTTLRHSQEEFSELIV